MLERGNTNMKKTKTRLLCLLLTVAALLVLAACETDTPDASAKFAPFSVEGVTVTVGEEAAPILERLGTPVSSAETAGCYGDGKDKVYQYRSYKVFTYSMGGVDYILSVELFDDLDFFFEPQRTSGAFTHSQCRIGHSCLFHDG